MDLHLVKELKNLLREKHWEEAITILTSVLENVVNQRPESQYDEHFNGILNFINQAVDCQDIILLCDLIEYELYPYIKSILEYSGGSLK